MNPAATVRLKTKPTATTLRRPPAAPPAITAIPVQTTETPVVRPRPASAPANPAASATASPAASAPALDESNALEIEMGLMRDPNIGVIIITHTLRNEVKEYLDAVYELKLIK